MTEGLMVSPAEARERGKVDFNFFAALAMPDIYTIAWPPFYLALFATLTAEEHINPETLIRFGLGLPRGHAKTTFFKLLAAWLIVYKYTDFVLIVCATDKLAENFLADVAEILGSPNFEAVYAPWHQALHTNTKRHKQAHYARRQVILYSLGAGSSIRGVNLTHKRPQCIICDDMQTRENDLSAAESEALINWTFATLFKSIANYGRRFIFYIGNLYSENCILYRLHQHSDWLTLITGAIQEDGTTLWEDMRSKESLLAEFKHDEQVGLGDIWFAEVMNIPASGANALISGPFPSPTITLETIVPDGAFITLDVGGDRTGSDDTVFTVYYVLDTQLYIAEMYGAVLDPKQTIEKAAELIMRHNATLLAIEDVAYQRSLIFWVNAVFQSAGITGIEVVPVSPRGRSKTRRIREFVSELYAGTVYFLRESDRQTFVWYAKQYDPTKKNNKDDWLDSPAYGLDVRNEHLHLVALPSFPKERARVIANNVNF